MKKILSANLLLLCFTIAFGQADTATIYKGLETKKIYAVGLSSHTSGGYSEYKVNGRVVGKEIYDKFNSRSWTSMGDCCPCIIESYNEQDILISKSVSCGDCGVGWFKKYYPNGNLKLIGRYKENATGDWENISERGYCHIEVGEWKYYNEDGQKIYSEFWKDGVFVKQVPEQPNAELWEVFLYLKGIKIDTQSISINEIKNIQIVPKYKNSNTNLNLAVGFEISAVDYPYIKREFSLEDFKSIDVNKLLIEAGIPKETETTFSLNVLHNKKVVRWYSLNIMK